jgi:hypothetical protein
MKIVVYTISGCCLAVLFLFTFAVPNVSLFYQSSNNQYSQVALLRGGLYSDLRVSRWAEKELAIMLYQKPPLDDSVVPSWRQLRNSFSSNFATDDFFKKLNSIMFYQHLIKMGQHTLFAPIFDTVVLESNFGMQWLVQTQGLLTFRSTSSEKTVQVVFTMEIKVDQLSGELTFSRGWMRAA